MNPHCLSGSTVCHWEPLPILSSPAPASQAQVHCPPCPVETTTQTAQSLAPCSHLVLVIVVLVSVLAGCLQEKVAQLSLGSPATSPFHGVGAEGAGLVASDRPP